MRVFVTGATGFIGSALVPELTAAGHTVVGLARSDTSAAKLAAAGAEAVRGELTDLDVLQDAAGSADGVAHLAFVHDFGNFDASARADADAITAMGEALAGSDKPLVTASGLLGLPSGRVVTERDEPVASARFSESSTLAFADRDVRAVPVRLAPSVHGEADRHGFVPTLIGIARDKGVSAYVGNGDNHWPAIHQLDAATLFRRSLESAPSGIVHGCGDEGIPTRRIAEVIGAQLGLPVVSVAPDQAAEHFGWIGAFFGLDVVASHVLTSELLGWEPTHPGLIADLEAGFYFAPRD